MLIVPGPYPRWNTRTTPSPPGIAFLRSVSENNFHEPWPGDTATFIDEFELPPRHDAEKGGAPDYAVLWEDRLWLIEFKTEKGSHRAHQIPGYFQLAHHHYPNGNVDFLYVTPPMTAAYEPAPAWARYAHTTWDDLVRPIERSWPSGSDSGEQRLIDGMSPRASGFPT